MKRSVAGSCLSSPQVRNTPAPTGRPAAGRHTAYQAAGEPAAPLRLEGREEADPLPHLHVEDDGGQVLSEDRPAGAGPGHRLEQALDLGGDPAHFQQEQALPRRSSGQISFRPAKGWPAGSRKEKGASSSGTTCL